MSGKTVTIFGGSGFIGRHLVPRLVAEGYQLRIATRNPNAAIALKTCAAPGQVGIYEWDRRHEKRTRALISGADIVINLIGILFETASEPFSEVQQGLPDILSRIAAEEGVTQFVQMSALGADSGSSSDYARTKANGEAAVRGHMPDAIIIRPSVVFGAGDGMYGRFAELSRISPFLPLIDGGTVRFQPVYVEDVAKAIVAALDDPSAAGKTYELGGPKAYSFKEILTYVGEVTGRKRILVPLPVFLANIKAWFFEFMPTPILTRDQIKLLAKDNILSGDCPGLRDLGIEPVCVEAVMPDMLAHHRTLAKRLAA